ncbi:Oidioi.mRNA.OKI2018_I69.chr1.g814.t1.cds [Oikopleura dioica]|uniref:Oidioi.mRNA.OKI2018_I69.chr1.g814.t1.cds n=1 Tax=Oikopleura dioica TaxID=34765 RepID=A0ABN7SR02_OIKDI|nr:Oidioi.mRNA.OKI2018_I69.chr1.g814.t1.cds [Oikopleura dioica]
MSASNENNEQEPMKQVIWEIEDWFGKIRFTAEVKGVICRNPWEVPGKELCTYCKDFVPQIKEFIVDSTGDTYRLTQNLACDHTDVVYYARCKPCKKGYVGFTTDMKSRLAGYKSNIVARLGRTAIEKHLREKHADSENPLDLFEIFPFIHYKKHEKISEYKAHESLWMQRFKTLARNGGGLNMRLEKGTCSCPEYVAEQTLLWEMQQKEEPEKNEKPKDEKKKNKPKKAKQTKKSARKTKKK